MITPPFSRQKLNRFLERAMEEELIVDGTLAQDTTQVRSRRECVGGACSSVMIPLLNARSALLSVRVLVRPVPSPESRPVATPRVDR